MNSKPVTVKENILVSAAINLMNKKSITSLIVSDKLKPIISDYHNKFGVTEFTKMKSSLKFCVIAASEFDIYVAEPRASEWDIAAGHAILQNAGGIVTDFENKEIYYGKAVSYTHLTLPTT